MLRHYKAVVENDWMCLKQCLKNQFDLIPILVQFGTIYWYGPIFKILVWKISLIVLLLLLFSNAPKHSSGNARLQVGLQHLRVLNTMHMDPNCFSSI